MSIRPSQVQENVFTRYFHISTSRFWHPLFGFDIIKFDDYMKSHHGYVEDGKTSLEDFLTQKFGQPASDLIKTLISQ